MSDQQVFDLNAADVSPTAWETLIDEVDPGDAWDSCGTSWCTNWRCTLPFCN